ncbi:MAG: lysozyme [Syntrophales bacterium]
MNRVAEWLAKKFEGYRLKPYRCPAGILTGGWGHAFRKGEKVRDLPEPEATEILHQDLSAAAISAFRQCPRLLLESEKRQGAIIDFTFNLGGGRLQASTLRRRINQGNWEEAARELRKWVYAAGRKLPGLVLRREAEAKLLI